MCPTHVATNNVKLLRFRSSAIGCALLEAKDELPHYEHLRPLGPIRSWKGAGLLLISVGLFASTIIPGSAAIAATARSPLLQGAYVGAADKAGLSAFSSATKTFPALASDALPYSGGWSDLDGAGGSLNWEFGGGWSGTPYTLSLAVPMIPTDAAGVAIATLADGATGAYNGYFVTLAHTLISAREANAYLRLGWEFDGGAYAWSATDPTAEADFAAYFRQIVTAMRSVSGERFRFVWNPTAAAFTDGYDLAQAYPGNSFVNEIGLDDYDQTWLRPQTSKIEWDKTTLPNLTAAHMFAASRHKPLAICEWGLSIRTDGHGLGDDPRFIDNFIAWMQNSANDVKYESYFDFDVNDQKDSITEGHTPKSLAAFTTALGRPSHTQSEDSRDLIIGAFVVGAGLVMAIGVQRRNRRTQVHR
jgi:hypothetical protein